MKITNTADLAYHIIGQVFLLQALRVATVESVELLDEAEINLQINYKAEKDPTTTEEIEDLLTALLVCPHVLLAPAQDSLVITQSSPYELACKIANSKEHFWTLDNPSFAAQVLAGCERRAQSLLAKFDALIGDHPVELQYRLKTMPDNQLQKLFDKINAPVLNRPFSQTSNLRDDANQT